MGIGKILRIALYVIVVGLLIWGMGWLILLDKNPIKGVSLSLLVSYILMALAIVAAVGAAVGSIIQQPKSAIRFLVGLGVMALIGLIGYSMSNGEVFDAYLDGGVATESDSRWVDAGLYLCYGVLGMSVAGIILSEVISIVKN